MRGATIFNIVTGVSVPFQSGLQIPNSEDEFSVGSFSEAEEKTIKAVCEQIKVCGRLFVVFWPG